MRQRTTEELLCTWLVAFGFLLSVMDLLQTPETHKPTVTSLTAGDDVHCPRRARAHTPSASIPPHHHYQGVRGSLFAALADIYIVLLHLLQFALLTFSRTSS